MKVIMLSIRPRFVAKILNGEKTIEIRKTMPKCDLPIDVYIYCTKSNYLGYISNRYIGKVVAKFTLNKVEEISFDDKEVQRKACLTEDELFDYLFDNTPYQEDMKKGYAWHIDNLVIFDKPKELSEFKPFNNGVPQYKFTKNGCEDIKLTKAPQSFMFIESENEND